MIYWSVLLPLLPLVSTLPLERRDTKVCDQFGTLTYGSYSLLNNLWGQSNAASGEQCSVLQTLDAGIVNWYTKWKWAGGDNIKSFPNIQLNAGINQQLSAISTMSSSWHWSQKNTGTVVADVAYDLFTSYSPGGSNLHEIMVWLANYNAGPISYNYDEWGNANPVATSLTFAGYTWNLYQGTNGYNEVFSFLPVQGEITEFNGDIYEFFSYLIDNGYIDASEYLVTAQAGTEATSGQATFVTAAYSLTIN